jgi:hypothetical protein
MLLNAQAKANDPGYRQTLDQLAMVSTQPEVWGVMDFALSAKNITDPLAERLPPGQRVGTRAMWTIQPCHHRLQQGMATEANLCWTRASWRHDHAHRRRPVAAANGLIRTGEDFAPRSPPRRPKP